MNGYGCGDDEDVAIILGWRMHRTMLAIGLLEELPGPAVWTDPDDIEHLGSGPFYTVDDLLEWFEKNCNKAWACDARYKQMGWGEWRATGGFEWQVRGRTLLEVLEEAVRMMNLQMSR